MNLWTVLFSFVIASLAGFVAFESIEHTRYSRQPRTWTFVSGVTLGLGIWSMHFVGMLAWEPPFPLYYSLGATLLSVLAAVAASWIAMHITVSYQDGLPQRNLLGGAAVVGCGIAAMHYTGMSALHFTQPVEWSVPGVLLSLVIAVFASLGALALLQRSGNDDFGMGRQFAASIVIGLAICGMHYTGMMAMNVPMGAVSIHTPGAFSGYALARVGVGNALVFTVCLLIVSYHDKVRLLEAANRARSEAQEASRNAERMVAAGRIAASISHEINNPLEAVTNLLYLVSSGNVGTEEREYLRQAEAELARISEITTHTLKFYRQQSSPVDTSLSDLLESAVTVFARAMESRHVTLTRVWDPAAPVVSCRAGEIRQVFANLISNALDAMPNGGTLRLSVRPGPDGSAMVEVADTGKGITPEVQKHILEPFFTTKGVGGTGLGLSICAEIVERHGGELTFTSSTTPGHSGTSFLILLPRFMKSGPPTASALTGEAVGA